MIRTLRRKVAFVAIGATSIAGLFLTSPMLELAPVTAVGNASVWPDAANYTVYNNNPSGAGSWANAFATLTSGGIVHVDTSVIYNQVDIVGFNPSAKLTIRAPTPTGPQPVINNFYIQNSSNLSFLRLYIEQTSWTGGDCVRLNGALSNFEFLDNDIRGTYRGVRNSEIDVTREDYPEYGGIYCREIPGFPGQREFSTRSDFGTGALAPNSRDGSYIGDLAPPGNYTAWQDVNSGTGAVCNYTVSALGYMTITSQTPGSGYTHAGNALSNDVRPVDQFNVPIPFLASKFASGFSSDGTAEMTGFLRINNNRFYQLNDVFKAVTAQGVGSTVEFIGNRVDKFYQDNVSISCGKIPGTLNYSWNFVTRSFSKSIDPGNPHSDNLQLRQNFTANGNQTIANWKDAIIEGNVYIRGNSRGSAQGVFIANFVNLGAVYRAENWRVCGNVGLNRGNVAFEFNQTKDAYVNGNIFALYMSDDSATAANMSIGNGPPSPGLAPYLASGGAQGYAAAFNNIAEAVSPAPSAALMSNNVEIAPNFAAYNAVFMNPDSSPTTLAELQAAYAVRAGVTAGPFYGGYVNYATRTLDRTLEPPAMRWPAVTGVAINSRYITPWSRYQGGPLAGRVVTPDAGVLYQTADDEAGTVGVSAWFSTPTTVVPGKFIRLDVPSGAVGATTITPGVTVAGVRRTLTLQTASTAFARVSNAGVATVQRGTTGIIKTDVQKLMIAVQFKFNTVAFNRRIFSGSGTSSRIELYQASANVTRMYMGSSGAAVLQFTNTMDTNVHTLIAQLDTTKVTAAEGIRGWLDGVEVTYSAPTFTSGVSFSIANIFNSISIGGQSAGANIADMQLGFLAIGYGDAADTMLDMSLSTNRDKFLKDNVGANWAVPFAGMENWFVWSGDQGAAAFNSASIPNLNTAQTLPLSNFITGWV